MQQVIALTLAGRFAWMIDILGQCIGRRSCWRTGGVPRLDPALLSFIYERALRWKARLLRYANAADPAALCPKPRARKPADTVQPRPQRPKPLYSLPRHEGWLVTLVPEAAQVGGYLLQLLQDPELEALLEAAPTLARYLRPLCFALGLRQSPYCRPLAIALPLKPLPKLSPNPAAPTARPARETPPPNPPRHVGFIPSFAKMTP